MTSTGKNLLQIVCERRGAEKRQLSDRVAPAGFFKVTEQFQFYDLAVRLFGQRDHHITELCEGSQPSIVGDKDSAGWLKAIVETGSPWARSLPARSAIRDRNPQFPGGRCCARPRIGIQTTEPGPDALVPKGLTPPQRSRNCRFATLRAVYLNF